ncbi:hypothetical protein [Nibribacter koreensis]
MKQFQKSILPLIKDDTLVFKTSKNHQCRIALDKFLKEFRLIASISTDYNNNQAYYFESNLDQSITMRIQVMDHVVSSTLAPNSYFEKHLTDIFKAQQKKSSK